MFLRRMTRLTHHLRRPSRRLNRQRPRLLRSQSHIHPRPDHLLHQKEKISRPRPADRRHRIDLVLSSSAKPSPPIQTNAAPQPDHPSVANFPGAIATIPAPTSIGVFGMHRITCSDFPRPRFFSINACPNPRRDRNHQRLLIHIRPNLLNHRLHLIWLHAQSKIFAPRTASSARSTVGNPKLRLKQFPPLNRQIRRDDLFWFNRPTRNNPAQSPPPSPPPR